MKRTLLRWPIALALLAGLAACSAPPAGVATAPAAAQATAAPGTPTPRLPQPSQAPRATLAATSAPPATAAAATAAPPATPIPAATATARPAATAPATPAVAVERAYVFPVRSKSKVSYVGSHHDYPATDIICPVGSEFVAVTDGVVDYVSREDRWDPQVNDGATRGGLSVAIVGDDGLRYYGSHLSQVAEGIAPGVRVVAGQLLGLTGKSGDAAPTAAHLHFGISRPTTPDDWAVRRGEILPYPYLKAWQRGQSLAPKMTR